MGVLLIVIGIAVVGIVLSFLLDDVWQLVCGIIGWLFAVVMIIMTIIALTLPLRVPAQLGRYEALKLTVQNARGQSDISQFERLQLLSPVIDTNKIIMVHRALHNSSWVGIFYHEELGKVDLILFE